jgi:hypothetical protein
MREFRVSFVQTFRDTVLFGEGPQHPRGRKIEGKDKRLEHIFERGDTTSMWRRV